MRVVFIDLHCNDFLVRHLGRIMADNQVKSFKHQYLLRYFIERGYDIRNLITEQGTKALFPIGYFTTRSNFLRKLESFFVERKNNLPRIKTIKTQDVLDTDILIAFLVYPNQISIIGGLNGYKVVFGNHFISINNPVDLNESGINAFVNEVNLSKNGFVQKYINISNCDNIILPYVYANRFKSRKAFNERINKAMAVGTASTCEGISGQYDLYREYFKTELIQPMRWEILNSKEQIKNYIDCYIGDIRSGSVENKVPQGFIERIKWRFESRKLGNQSDYTSFDMVETFNSYKMFICPEELVGMPGIGAIEGMACGTAYLGIKHEMYDSLGFIPGVHYISYDGTLDGMLDVIKEYQNKPDELATIAQKGCEYVRAAFNERAVLERFMLQLRESYNNYINTLK